MQNIVVTRALLCNALAHLLQCPSTSPPGLWSGGTSAFFLILRPFRKGKEESTGSLHKVRPRNWLSGFQSKPLSSLYPTRVLQEQARAKLWESNPFHLAVLWYIGMRGAWTNCALISVNEESLRLNTQRALRQHCGTQGLLSIVSETGVCVCVYLFTHIFFFFC